MRYFEQAVAQWVLSYSCCFHLADLSGLMRSPIASCHTRLPTSLQPNRELLSERIRDPL